MEINYNNIIAMSIDYIEEFKKQYLLELENDNIDEESGPHTVFSLVFNPILFYAIKNNDKTLINKIFKLIEQMEVCGDNSLAEVAEFTILEELADEFEQKDIINYMGIETKKAYKQICNYIKCNKAR